MARSLCAILNNLHHVLRAARGYVRWMCEVLELPDPEIRTPPESSVLAHEAASYMEHALDQWRAPLRDVGDDRLYAPEYRSRWKSLYCIEGMLVRSCIPIRHLFQLEELLRRHDALTDRAST